MPVDFADYPQDWREISRRVRFERAGGRCECAGECGRAHSGGRCLARHGDLAYFLDEGVRAYVGDDGAERIDKAAGAYTPRATKVWLTTAHLWRGPCAGHYAEGVKCGEESHLKAMCQACHLAYDMPHHVENARRTRGGRKDAGRALLEGADDQADESDRKDARV